MEPALSPIRIEMEVESLEGQESMISAKESFILNRLKAVEKTLFAMEVNVSKDLLTGTSTVLSTATVPPEALEQHTGRKVYDDGRKCVYALNSQESCESQLSASEVEHLLRSATVHRQAKHRNPGGREEHLYCYHSHDALCSSRVPSPLYADDPPYTIINAMETTEPITAIFMGFQTAQDDSMPAKECEDSLKAELVIIEDAEDSEDDHSMKEKKLYVQPGDKSYSRGSSANGNVGRMEGVGDRWTERRVGPGIRKIQKKHKACCTVC
uniref:Palmdelphin n=1 Tax=Sander lucioperca TaxID=283035 RepID=A0A8C9ZXE9_SANLU